MKTCYFFFDLLFGFFVIVYFVDYAYYKIRGDYYEIKHIQPQNVSRVAADDFARNTANITDNYYNGENKALAFAASGLNALHDRYGPRNPETN